MIDTDADPAGVAGDIANTIWNRLAEIFDQEVMHADLLRLALRTPLAAAVLEVADQFLFLGVDRDPRLMIGQSLGHTLVDIVELRVPIGVGAALRYPGD
jgi:hypothetical protein